MIQSGVGFMNHWLMIYGSSPSKKFTVGNGPEEDRAAFSPTASGYFVECWFQNPLTEPYQVTYYEEDYADDSSTQASIQIGTSRNGTLEVPWDRDNFLVSLTAGHTYSYNLLTSNPKTQISLIRLLKYTTTYNYQVLSMGAGSSFTSTTTGTYWLQVSSDYFAMTYKAAIWENEPCLGVCAGGKCLTFFF